MIKDSKNLENLPNFNKHLGDILGISDVYSDLFSVNRTYKHLVDVFIPTTLSEVLKKVGLKNIKIKRSINLSETLCLNYYKTRSYQWTVRFTFQDDKVHTKRILELPVMDDNGIMIINGIHKVFCNKFRRRNVIFNKLENGSKTCTLVSLRNKRLILNLNSNKVYITITDEISDMPLEEFIKTYFSDKLASSIFKLNKSYIDKDLEKSLTKKVKKAELPAFRLLERDSILISDLTGIPFNDLDENIANLNVLIALIDVMLDSKWEIIFDHRNILTKCFVTFGGMIKEMIERAWLGAEHKKLTVTGIMNVGDTLVYALNSFDLKKRIRSLTSDGSFMQILDDINPLSEIIHVRKFSLLYKGLLGKRSVTVENRNVNIFQLGRSCFISTTEGQAIGLIQHLSIGTRIDEKDDMLTAYFKVENGKIIRQIVWLKPTEEVGVYITDVKNIDSDSEMILARFNSSFVMVPREWINYVFILPGQTSSLAVNLLVRSNNSESDRILTAGNMVRQSLVLKWPNESIYKSIYFNQLTKWSSQYKDLTHMKKLYSSATLCLMLDKDNKYQMFETGKFYSTNYKTIKSCRVFEDEKGIKLLPYPVKNGIISMGCSLRCAYMTWYGYTFEDSIVVARSVVDSEKLNSLHLHTLKVPVYMTKNGPEKLTRSILNAERYDIDHLNDMGIVKPNTYVRYGDILVSKLIPMELNMESHENRLLKALFGGTEFNVKNDFFRLPEDLDGATVLSVDIVKGHGKNQTVKDYYDEKLAHLQNEYTEILKIFAQESLPKKKITSDSIDKVIETLLSGKGISSIEDTTTVKSWARKFHERSSEIIANFEAKKTSLNIAFGKQEYLCTVEINLMLDRPVRVGDKLTGLHGNKGVISRIVNDEDMPYDQDGRHVELIMSSLSVYGRLNYGQIVESRIGLLSEKTVEWIKQAIKMYELTNDNRMIDSLKKVREYIGLPMVNNNDIVSWAKDISHTERLGMVDIPFDDIDNNRIKSLEDYLNVSETSQLRCGMTGEKFLSGVHVGRAYILKLMHTAASKYSCRSLGDYNVKFNQPVRGGYVHSQNAILSSGRAQRLGTMEVAALIARNLPKFLHESLHYKSDRIESSRLFTAERPSLRPVVRSESFNICKLYFMCLGIKLYEHGNSVKISLLPSHEIEEKSNGEVTVAETMHYKTQKPIEGGLFCDKIFGNGKDYECSCGRYSGRRYKGMICGTCGVLVESKDYQRGLYGHIKLCSPIINTRLFVSEIKDLIGIKSDLFRSICSFKKYLAVTDNNEIIYGEDWRAFPDSLKSYSGAEAINVLLQRVDVRKKRNSYMLSMIRSKITKDSDNFIRWENLYRYANSFLNGENSLNDLIIRHIFILPKALRPLVFTGGGAYVSTEINSMYLQIIRRNESLKKMIQNDFLPVIVEHSKAMLQELIDALMWTGVKSKEKNTQSIADMMKGKHGIFRQNMLSKRINFSLRGTIVVNPNLTFGTVRIPRFAARKIFLPYIHRSLVDRGLASDTYSAYTMLKKGEVSSETMDEILSEIISRVPVIINRNPTLHILGIQGVYVELSDNYVIEIHPLMCDAMGADFDGDTMSIWAPVFDETAEELREKLVYRSVYNFSNGKIVLKPTKEIGIGLYLLTKDEDDNEAILTDIKGVESLYHDRNNWSKKICLIDRQQLITTVGRFRIANIWESTVGIIPERILKQACTKKLLDSCMDELSPGVYKLHKVIELCEKLKNLANAIAGQMGVSFSSRKISDNSVHSKKNITDSLTQAWIAYREGLITIDQLHDETAKEWMSEVSRIQSSSESLKLGDHHDVVRSGFRGNYLNIGYLTHTRGYISMEKDYMVPITSSLSDGYSDIEIGVLSFTRKELVTKSIITWVGGYLNRQLVEVLREFKVTMNDCGTQDGTVVNSSSVSYRDLIGKNLLEDVKENDWKRNQMIDPGMAKHILDNNLIIKIRSPSHCKAEFGVCSLCYGQYGEEWENPQLGDMIGIRTAQAISEPITQLLMKTKHKRELLIQEVRELIPVKSRWEGKVSLNNVYVVVDTKGNSINISTGSYMVIDSVKINIPYSSIICVRDGESITHGQVILKVRDQHVLIAPKECFVEDITFTWLKNHPGVVMKTKNGEILGSRLVSKDCIIKYGKVSEGEVVCYEKIAAEEEIIKNEFIGINMLLAGKQTGDYDMVSPSKSILSMKGDTLVLTSVSGNIIDISHHHRLSIIPKETFDQDDLVAIGKKGISPTWYLQTHDVRTALRMYSDEMRAIYTRNSLEVLSIHLEVFLSELLGLARTWTTPPMVVRTASITNLDDYIFLNRTIKSPYSYEENFLDTMSYEDVCRNAIMFALQARSDNLRTVHSNLILGRITPIGSYYERLENRNIDDTNNIKKI